MAKTIKIKIDGKEVLAKEGQTILEAAEKAKAKIPSLCYHRDLCAGSSCRVCVVEVAGKRGMKTACSTKIREGMEIITDSPKIRKARKINLELIFAQHIEECNDCVWKYRCKLLELAKEYEVKITRFPDRKKKKPVYQFGPSYIFDSTKCIDCRNCVEVCQMQDIGFYEIKGRGYNIKTVPSAKNKKECIYCGQCILHCPVGAFEAVGEFEDIEKPLLEKDKVVVVQFAPSIRTSIGEEFDMPHGSVVTDRLAAGIRTLGVDKVFDTSVGADFTTMEEAKELIGRLEGGGKMPMFTSCCPGWVRHAEFYHPEILPHLTTVRSPHIILGGVIKTYWAKKNKIDPKKIVVVSVMPCVAKKYEIERPELKINGLKPVDYVLTTRELAFLMKKKNIDLKTVKPRPADNPLGVPSGAGVIYGASGGVMESALRTACHDLCGKKMERIEFEEVRGEEGVKKATVKFAGKELKVAVANGIRGAEKILKELKKNPGAYDYAEIMACFGGCIGGGGQPVPTDSEIRRKRAKALYDIDSNKEEKKEPRTAHDSPIIKEVYSEYFKNKKDIHPVCHTGFSKEPKAEIKKYKLE